MVVVQACSTESEESDSSSSSIGSCTSNYFGAGVPAWISSNFSCANVVVSGAFYVFTVNDIPNHNSYYFGSSDSRYESMSGGNPNVISEQNYTFNIPITPNTTGQSTTGDAIGVATNGVVFFNDEAAPGDTLAAEVSTFDALAGHPTGGGVYHYHSEPTYLSSNDANIIGVLRDGYAVFGQLCPDNNLSPGSGTAALDGNNGHTANTRVTGLGSIYHYHINDLGQGIKVVTGDYYGAPGTFTNN